MTKDEALDKALEALEKISMGGDPRWANDVIPAIKQARSAQVQGPVAFFDWYDNAHWGNEDFKEGCHRSWNAAIKYTTPPAQPAPVQEPVAWMDRDGDLYANEPDKNWCPPHYPLYTTPPAAQRQWVGLTDEEYSDLYFSVGYAENVALWKAIEAKLKEKNT